MKIKQSPDDFQVQELTEVVPHGEGNHAFYKLEKTNWSTPDAITAIRRRWRLKLGDISFGGLKDRHARTVQYLSILRGPRRGLRQGNLTLTYLGQIREPYTSTDIRANRFRVVLRDLKPTEISGIKRAIEEIRMTGVPNYFDDQRFGSVVKGGEFVARLLVLGRFEDALKLAMAAPCEHDRALQKHEKAVLRQYWGNWQTCLAKLSSGPAAALVKYLLSHPNDFRGGVARLHPELRGLYLSAYQSYLWNKMLALWMQQHCRSNQLLTVRLRLGEVPMHRRLEEAQFRALAALVLPLPSARLKLAPDNPLAPLVHEVLAREELELHQLRVRGIRTLFFSKGERPALCLPRDLQSQTATDERHGGRQKVVLDFELQRGCYATLVVKRVTA